MRLVRSQVTELLDYLRAIPDKPDRTSLFACFAALVRLQNTFRAAVITTKSGMHFESAGLARMILEQLAWIYVIHKIEDDEADFFEVRPSRCIGDLKRFLPDAGWLYGELSKVSHIEPKQTRRFIRMEDGDLRINLSDLRWSQLDAYTLLILSDYFSLIGEYIYADLLENFRYLERDAGGELIPNAQRVFQGVLSEQQRILVPYEEDSQQGNAGDNTSS